MQTQISTAKLLSLYKLHENKAGITKIFIDIIKFNFL